MSACEECWEAASRDVMLLGGSVADRYQARLSVGHSRAPAPPVGFQPADGAELERLRNGIVLLTASFEVKGHDRQAASLRALLDPVGVQPEPAEPSEWADPQLERQMKAAWKEADRHRAQPAGPGIPAHCGVCFTAWPCEVAQDRPAVPVVHPEPGDRADVGTEFVQQVEAIERGDMDEPLAEWEETLLREDRWLATIWPSYSSGRLRNDEHNLDLARSIMALADVEVAAAVAAVRADLAAEVRAKAKHPPSDPGWVQAVNFVEGYNRALEDAAVLIRGVR